MVLLPIGYFAWLRQAMRCWQWFAPADVLRSPYPHTDGPKRCRCVVLFCLAAHCAVLARPSADVLPCCVQLRRIVECVAVLLPMECPDMPSDALC
jgi:hypothetical protein